MAKKNKSKFQGTNMSDQDQALQQATQEATQEVEQTQEAQSTDTTTTTTTTVVDGEGLSEDTTQTTQETVAEQPAKEVTQVETPVAPAAPIEPPKQITPAPAVKLFTKEPTAPAVSGTVNPSTTSAVGTASKQGAVNAALVSKISDSVKADLGIIKFTKEGQELIERVLDSGSEITKRTVRDVLLYTKEMAPGVPMDINAGSLKQVNLYRTLMNSINNAGPDFQLMFATVLRIVFETKDTGAFQVRYAFRFFPSMALNKADRDSFSNLLHAMLQLCNPSGRAIALKQIDFNKLVASGYTPQGRQRMLSFFNI